MHLPKYFTIYKSSGFKFYKNTVRHLEINLYAPLNLVEPVSNVTIEYVSKYTKKQDDYNGTLGRDLLRRVYPFKWRFTGYEIMVNIDQQRVAVPDIHFSECETLLLPSGSPVIIPNTSLIRWQARARSYEQAVLIEDSIPIAAISPLDIKQSRIAESIKRNEVCPINAEPLTHENACITTCGHVFTKSAITEWLSVSSNKSCPICRQTCSLA